MNSILFVILALFAVTSSPSANQKDLPEIRLIKEPVRIILTVTKDETSSLRHRMSDAMAKKFCKDFGAYTVSKKYNWEHTEEHVCYFNNKECVAYDSFKRPDGLTQFSFICLVNDRVYIHSVVSPYPLTEEQDMLMLRGIKWKVFALFSLTEEDRANLESGKDDYPVDSIPEITLTK